MNDDLKPIVLVDMDGVLADFDGPLFDLCNSLGLDFDIDGINEQKHRFLTDHLPSREDTAVMEAIVRADGWFRNMPVIEGAQQGMAELDELAEVYLCSKPLESSPSCGSDKFAWIAEHFPEFVGRLNLMPNKSLMIGDVLLDDAPKKKYMDLADWVPVIYEHPWNTGDGPEAYPDRLTRFQWGDDVSVLVDIAEARAQQKFAS